MKIKCDNCFKEYDDSHMEGYEDFEKQDAAIFDGWVIKFLTECPECREKYKTETNK